jgi:hypothetical protein
MLLRFPRRGLILAMVVLLAPVAPRAGASSLDVELGKVAKNLAKFLDADHQADIAIGQITAPPQLVSSGGQGVKQILTTELAKLGVENRRRAKYGVTGKFLPEKDPDSGRPAARIDLEVLSANGEVMLHMTQFIDDTSEVASLFGATVDLDPNLPRKQRDEQLTAAIANPAPAITRHTLRSSPDSPYGIEIWVRQGDDYVPRDITDDEGFAFVDLKPEDIYAIQLINESPHDATVTVTIDGINLFAFSEQQSYRSMILGKEKQRALIKGWHRTNAVSDAFQITSYAKSAAAELLQDGSEIGSITVQFAAAWPQDEPPPADELGFKLATRGSGLATGRGPAVDQNYTEVRRVHGAVRSIVSVRYSK